MNNANQADHNIKQTDHTKEKIPLIVIAGPTATGKTSLAIELAERVGGEIISADSVQVYRYLDIGSAKPTAAEIKDIPHYMLDLVDPDVNFTVFDYQTIARKHIWDIYKRGKQPILVGGTGLYIKALVDGYSFRSGKVEPAIRKQLQEELDSFGKEHLYRKLQEIDPERGAKLHINDTKRIIRALEYYYMTGEPISRQQEMTITGAGGSPAYRLLMIGLHMQREVLYDAINHRVDLMLEKGLLHETENLMDKGFGGDLKAMQSLGYRHMSMYLQKKWEWDEAVSMLKQDTRKFAKRQMTWFQADKRINWFEIEPGREPQSQPAFNEIIEKCLKFIGLQ